MPSPEMILITGCSSAGKSTLLQALGAKGYATIPEPGRRVIAQARANGTKALPWTDMRAFAESALSMAKADLAQAQTLASPVFFDRGVIDAALALHHTGGPSPEITLKDTPRYAKVFLAPPWPEIYVNDADRQHGFDAALEEYTRIRATLTDLGYAPLLLPKANVETRSTFVLNRLDTAP